MFLLLLLFPIIEIYVLVQVGARIGFINTVFALLFAAVLGAGLARSQGRFILRTLQENLARGQVPAKQVLQGLLVFIGGVLFLIPGFVSDFVALLFILPGIRHIIAGLLRRKLERQSKTGQFKVFTYGFGAGAGPRTRPARPTGDAPRPLDDQWTRDVSPKVIDVKPLSSETYEKPDSSDPTRV